VDDKLRRPEPWDLGIRGLRGEEVVYRDREALAVVGFVKPCSNMVRSCRRHDWHARGSFWAVSILLWLENWMSKSRSKYFDVRPECCLRHQHAPSSNQQFVGFRLPKQMQHQLTLQPIYFRCFEAPGPSLLYPCKHPLSSEKRFHQYQLKLPSAEISRAWNRTPSLTSSASKDFRIVRMFLTDLSFCLYISYCQCKVVNTLLLPRFGGQISRSCEEV